MSKIDEGTAQIEKAAKLSRENLWARPRLAQAYVMAGRRAEAEGIVREAKEAMSTRYVPGTILALLYAILGETDLVFESLNRAVGEGTSTIVILSEPVFDNPRSDPRFSEILKKSGYPTRLCYSSMRSLSPA